MIFIKAAVRGVSLVSLRPGVISVGLVRMAYSFVVFMVGATENGEALCSMLRPVLLVGALRAPKIDIFGAILLDVRAK